MKLGEIGEEMVATAVRLAQDGGATVEALYVIKVPLDQPLDAPLYELEEQAAASLAEARALGADHGVEVERPHGPRARDRRRDRRGGRRERRRPDRARLVAALAAPVALLLADRRLRPAQVATARGPDRRLPAGRPRGLDPRYAASGMNALIIGCGRVGSTIALQLHKEELGRDRRRRERGRALAARRELAGRVPRRPRHGHRPAARGRDRGGRRGRRRHRRRQHEHRHRPGRAEALRHRAASSCASSTRRAPTSTPRAGCAPSARRRRRSTR